jgi:CRP/FNR family cyclic AMP-dependent transcriptional regulator
MPGPHDFFGEGALVKQSLRISTATTLEASTILLSRNLDLEEDICDQLFNHSEKRLARVLLKLARLGEHGVALDATVPVLSHETLAEMVGTTRSRISHFMNKFRTMGLIEYNGELTISKKSGLPRPD